MKKFAPFLIAAAVLLSACGSKPTVDTNVPDKARKYNEIIQKAGDVTDPVHGTQTAVFYGAISGAAPVKANGIAFVRSFADGASVVTVNVNILKATSGHYSVVLKNGKTGAKIDIGSLESILGDTRHSVETTTKEDVKGFSTVLVYLGKTLQAEGTLKEDKR